MNRLALLAVACAIVPGCALSDCQHTAPRELSLDSAAVTTLDLSTGAGSLQVRGEPGLERIEARGTACASDPELLNQVRLVERRDGATAYLVAEMPESSGGWFGGDSSRLDLVVRVPARLLLQLTDSSGEVEVRNLAGARIEDSSGALTVADIAGDVTVSDSSGSIRIETVGGSVRIPSDSSGGIVIDQVVGDALIEDDSSGDIELSQIQGDAIVQSDSSGGIRFSTIGGSARVDNDSSGSIVADDVGGDFVVGSDGSGGIRHERVRGSVRIPQD